MSSLYWPMANLKPDMQIESAFWLPQDPKKTLWRRTPLHLQVPEEKKIDIEHGTIQWRTLRQSFTSMCVDRNWRKRILDREHHLELLLINNHKQTLHLWNSTEKDRDGSTGRFERPNWMPEYWSHISLTEETSLPHVCDHTNKASQLPKKVSAPAVH